MRIHLFKGTLPILLATLFIGALIIYPAPVYAASQTVQSTNCPMMDKDKMMSMMKDMMQSPEMKPMMMSMMKDMMQSPEMKPMMMSMMKDMMQSPEMKNMMMSMMKDMMDKQHPTDSSQQPVDHSKHQQQQQEQQAVDHSKHQ
ncbi:hypothetical protein [Azotosporobacter soli]|uniref:hypothetical protein n=1 Tax=Azotosporobacter soli TaxID=3055040 RepID=UPI0031FEBBE8